ncbi:MAG: TonB-dependent receptor [Flavipsychrobacter sp.]|nr:TonB-dependent receptor [Flavipsychrobacter sp.]
MLAHKHILLIVVTAIQLLCAQAYAQRKSDTLKEVKVKGTHHVSNEVKVNEFSPGQKVKTIDSSTLQQYQLQNMASLLSQQVPVFVKSYGFNGLATLNFRGSSAAQSTVLWNGVPIQNAALGIADVSTLPVLFMSKVNIVYGGSAALWGSGNVGGALLLEHEVPVFDSGKRTLSVSGGGGSFGQYMGGVKGSASFKRWYLSANVFAQSAQNNFSYVDHNGITTKMPNGSLQSGAAMLRAAYKIDANNTVSISGWYQQYGRELPPALFETSSDKKQTDGSLRLLADWNRKTEKNTWYAKSSFIKDEVRYRDDAVMLRSDNNVYQYYQELGWRKQWGRYGQLLLFSPVQLSWLIPPSTNIIRHQDKAALAGAYNIKRFNDRLSVAINARGEQINTQSFLLPGADASFALTEWLVLRANAQRTYRAPTLNELYYFPGGNPDLKPEQGWNEDAGYTLKFKAGRFTFLHDLSVYNRNIHDWIVWLGGAIWTPHNIAEVHSRGVETENNITCTMGKWNFHIGVNTSYTIATTVASYIPNDGSEGKQIPYTPRYNGQANIGFGYKQISVNYNQTYTGYRFVSTDESEYIMPYQTGNLMLMYNLMLHGHSLLLTAQANNIWDQRYEIVNGRPMPGINWLAGFRMTVL